MFFFYIMMNSVYILGLEIERAKKRYTNAIQILFLVTTLLLHSHSEINSLLPEIP